MLLCRGKPGVRVLPRGWLQSFDWHLIFLVTLPVGFVAWIVGVVVIQKDSANGLARLDWPGLLLATGGSLALFLNPRFSLSLMASFILSFGNWLNQVFSAMALGLCTSLFYFRLSVHLAESGGGVEGTRAYSLAYMHSIHDVFLVSSVIVACAIPIALLFGRRMSAPLTTPKGLVMNLKNPVMGERFTTTEKIEI